MASKFMVNSAFEARLFRPFHQRTVLFGYSITSQPMWSLICSSRTYSESIPTSPLQKDPASSRNKDEDWFFKSWNWIPTRLKRSGMMLGMILGATEYFFRAALKYKQKHKTVPVLIIDNVDRLTYSQKMILDLFQDYAKLAADQGTATIVFISSEGHVPRHMMGKSVMFVILFIC
jgi:hypothetical protein